MKMNKENKVENKVVVVDRKNFSSVIDFVINSKNKSVDVLKNEYIELGYKSLKNVDRVMKRVKREEIKNILLNILKEKNLNIEKYLELEKKIIENFRDKKDNNFLKVELIE